MKLFTTAAMALALTGAAAAAYADNPPQNGQPKNAPQHTSQPHGGPGSGGQQHGGPGGAGQQHGQVAGPGGQQHGQGGGPGGQQHFNGQAQGVAAGQQHFSGQAQGGPGGQQHFSGQAAQGGGQQQWQGRGGQGGASAGLGFQNHALRGRDQGRSYYSANAVSRQYRAQRQYRFGGYSVFPSGWAYRSWYFGAFLPLGWYSSQYYLDWADYGLPPPPIGCEWIAEGPDAVLVDVWTGEVLSVYQGVFYWNGY
jgi:Ni/Co efflux regulator RcnB